MKKSFKNLVLLAQQESAPCVNVADDVLSALSGMSQEALNPYRAYTWFGAASAAVAACIAVTATLFLQSNTDSVSEMMTYVSWVAQ